MFSNRKALLLKVLEEWILFSEEARRIIANLQLIVVNYVSQLTGECKGFSSRSIYFDK